jgi:aspartate/methionine/tyrosine aminotransferase
MFLKEIEGSTSLEMVNLVLQKISEGKKIVSLAIGEPSFDTPPEIIKAAYESMNAGGTRYVSSYGIPEVREAVKRKVLRKNGIHAEVPNIIFSAAKLSIYASLMAVSNHSYDALIPDPGFFYSEPVVLSGGRPVRYRLTDDFSLDLDEIKKKATKETKAIIINSPSNPTGKVFSRTEFQQLYDICFERDITIISDEAYEDLVYGRTHFSVGSLEKEPRIVVSIYSLSKSYSMTGWRAGYIVANPEVIRLVNRLFENTLTCFPPFIQKASAFALDNCDARIAEFRNELAKRKKALEEMIGGIDALEANEIEGTFYAFPKLRVRMSSRDLSVRLLEEKNVALLAGTSFGPAGEGHIRISFSGSPEVTSEGMKRLKDFLAVQHVLTK